MKLTAVLMLSVLSGCVAFMHRPEVSAKLSDVRSDGKVCGRNVLSAEPGSLVVLEACVANPLELTTRFGTMSMATAAPSNWTVQVTDPDGRVIIDAQHLEGNVDTGACGSSGCSWESEVTFTLPQPWRNGTYTVRCASKAPPELRAGFHLTISE